jgi:hypothetical protein
MNESEIWDSEVPGLAFDAGNGLLQINLLEAMAAGEIILRLPDGRELPLSIAGFWVKDHLLSVHATSVGADVIDEDGNLVLSVPPYNVDESEIG